MINPPKAKKIKQELLAHGETRIDNYYWLNQRDNKDVIKYLEEENKYTADVLKHTDKLQEKIYNEIVGRIKPVDSSVPFFDNEFFYFKKFIEGGEYPIYCRKKSLEEKAETVLLDCNKMAKGLDYFQLGSYDVSPNNKTLAYSIDTVSRRKYDIYFKELTTGKISEEIIKNTTGSITWANDNKTIFYVVKDKSLRAYKIFKHTLGTPVSADVEVYHEKDETFGVYVYKTKSKKFIIIGSYSTLSDEYRFINADNPDENFKIIQPRESMLEYSVDHFENNFLIRTNYKAKNFKLVTAPIDNPIKENWKDLIPHNEKILLESFEVFKNYLVSVERENGLIQIRVISWKDKSEHLLNFGEEVYSAAVSNNYELNSDELRYVYSSLTTPNSTIDYHMGTRNKTILKEEEVVGSFNKNDYQSERLFAKSRDGKSIPISLVYKKGLKKNSDNPLLLYGYGSYGYSIEPNFNSVRLSLLDRGFIFAIAHIRGGEELGRNWYEDGKLLKKKNTFEDFISCGEFLIEQKFTSKEKLFAYGGSAGGLLVGAVINMRPDLFKGAVAAVPFVDVITTMLDDSIPLTTGEYDEWGNPNEKEFYDYMLSYSPYDNVEKKDYPALLVTAGLHDSQVQYWEPAKWVAKLREYKTDKNMLLLHTNMDAGHSGKSGRFIKYKEDALEFAFILNQLGISE